MHWHRRLDMQHAHHVKGFLCHGDRGDVRHYIFDMERYMGKLSVTDVHLISHDSKEQIHAACKIALSHQLFLHKGAFEEMFREEVDNLDRMYQLSRMVICFNRQHEAIGCAVIWSNSERWSGKGGQRDRVISAFVKNAYRRKGIGLLMADAILTGNDDTVSWSAGVAGSQCFWGRVAEAHPQCFQS